MTGASGQVPLAPPIANSAEPIMNRTAIHQPIRRGAQKRNQW